MTNFPKPPPPPGQKPAAPSKAPPPKARKFKLYWPPLAHLINAEEIEENEHRTTFEDGFIHAFRMTSAVDYEREKQLRRQARSIFKTILNAERIEARGY